MRRPLEGKPQMDHRHKDIVARLRSRGYIQTQATERVLALVKREFFLSGKHRLLADCNIPVPFYCAAGRVRTLPSPALTAVLLEMLEIDEGMSVLLFGSAGGYMAALAQEMTKRGMVCAIEKNFNILKLAQGNLKRPGFLREVGVKPAISMGELLQERGWDRILVLPSFYTSVDRLRTHLADLGFVLRFACRGEEYSLAKTIRSGDDYLNLFATSFQRPHPQEMSRRGEKSPSVDIDVLLRREEMINRIWEGRVLTTHERSAWQAVESTFGRDEKKTQLPWKRRNDVALAKKVFHIAYAVQLRGELKDAIDLYRRSIETCPTGEAHTFLGWTYGFLGRYDDAIDECKRAINIDPDFGNPYNDIGAYLLEQGKWDEAIPWLKKAIEAKRYSSYFYAHCNLGRAYMMKGLFAEAKEEFLKALRLNPNYEPAQAFLRALEKKLL